VRPGHKQTDVGTIPNDWEVKRLGELASISAGGTPSRSIAKYWNGDIPWITTSELDFGTVSQADQFISKEGLNNSAAKILPPGTLLMALYGQGKTRGKVAVLGIEAATNQACAAISLSRGVSGAFVLHFLGSRYEAIRNLSNTGNQENLNSSLVRSIPIVLPQKAEQEAIAEALSDADALIESLEQLLNKKRQIKKGAMQELLTGKKRLAGFKGKSGYRQTEAGEVPEDWEVKRVAEMGDVRAGKALAVRGAGPQRPYLRTKNVFDGRIDVGDVLQMPMTDAEFARYRLRRGDVLLNEGQSIELVGRSAMYKDEYPEPCAIQNQLVRFRARQSVSGSFAAHVFRRCQTSGVFSRIALQTTSVAHLGVSRFAKLPLPWPPSLAEQEAIAQALDDADAVIDSLEQVLRKKRQIKQGMMQELLTGRIRLV